MIIVNWKLSIIFKRGSKQKTVKQDWQTINTNKTTDEEIKKDWHIRADLVFDLKVLARKLFI